MGQYNYAAAFLAFTQGSTINDISMQLGIPLKTLEGEARQHGWSRLSTRLKLAAPKTGVEVSLDHLKTNREKSLKEVAPLEKEFDYIIQLNDQLRTELAYWDDQISTCQNDVDAAKSDLDVAPGPDIVEAARRAAEQLIRAREIRDTLRMYLANPKRYKELAVGLAQVHELRYRALGDVPNVQSGNKPDAHRTLTQIVVNMPSVVARPRQPIEVQTVADAPEGD
jgi:hypothetical protein